MTDHVGVQCILLALCNYSHHSVTEAALAEQHDSNINFRQNEWPRGSMTFQQVFESRIRLRCNRRFNYAFLPKYINPRTKLHTSFYPSLRIFLSACWAGSRIAEAPGGCPPAHRKRKYCRDFNTSRCWNCFQMTVQQLIAMMKRSASRMNPEERHCMLLAVFSAPGLAVSMPHC